MCVCVTMIGTSDYREPTGLPIIIAFCILLSFAIYLTLCGSILYTVLSKFLSEFVLSKWVCLSVSRSTNIRRYHVRAVIQRGHNARDARQVQRSVARAEESWTGVLRKRHRGRRHGGGGQGGSCYHQVKWVYALTTCHTTQAQYLPCAIQRGHDAFLFFCFVSFYFLRGLSRSSIIIYHAIQASYP